MDPRKITMVIEFNNGESASIKSFAVKKRGQIKVTTRFMSGKLLMFSEIHEDKFRDIIFEVIIESEIYKRFDSLHEFWDIFNARKKRETS